MAAIWFHLRMASHYDMLMLIQQTEHILGWSDLMIVGWYSMTGAVHLTAIRLIEHTILVCWRFCLAVLTAVCYPALRFRALIFAIEIERHVKGIQSIGTSRQHPPFPQAPLTPLYLIFLVSDLFFYTIVPGQLFHHPFFFVNCLVYKVCLGLLPNYNSSSRFSRLVNSVYVSCMSLCVYNSQFCAENQGS